MLIEIIQDNNPVPIQCLSAPWGKDRVVIPLGEYLGT